MGHLPQVFRDLVARLNADQPLGTSRPPLSSGGRTRNEPTQGRLLCLHVGRGITHITGVHFSYAPEKLGEYQAIEAVVPWLKFESTVAEAQTLAQPEEFDYLALLDERYGSVRRFAPLLLEHFEFHAAPSAAELLLALNLLRDLNASGSW
jgi:hypothetical protein